jgi:hypothetical protein
MKQFFERTPKWIHSLIVCVFIVALLVSGAFIIKTQTSFVSAAPITGTADASRMLPVNGTGLQLEDDILQNVGTPDINKAETEEIKDGENKDEGLEPTETDRPDLPSDNQEDKENVPDKNENKQPDTTTPQDEEQPGNTNPPGQNPGNSDPIPGDGGNPSDGPGTPTDNPGDTPEPSDQKDDRIFFETDIINGFTIQSREYKFKLTHNFPELTVRGVQVYVGSALQPGWSNQSNRVLLNEGKNIIRVAVDYIDKDNKVISVYKDYMIYVDLGEVIINTSLIDQSVNRPDFSLTASATYRGDNVSISVTHNGNTLSSNDGIYSVKLSEGSNTFVLSAEQNGKSRTKTYTVIYNAPKEVTIITSLTNYSQSNPKIIHGENISFTASIIGGTDKAKLTVVCDGVTLTGNNGSYSATISKMNMPVTIRLKATDKVEGKNVEVTEYYYVKYIPVATEETAPRLKYINRAIDNGENIKGTSFTLDIDPVDYKGNSLGYNNVIVRLNGETIDHRWHSNYISYPLLFKGGANRLDIRVTDDDGRYADYSYIVNCIALKDGDSLGTITISLDASVLGLGYLIPSTEIEIFQGETGAQIIDRLLKANGFTYEHTGTFQKDFYLARVCKPGMTAGAQIPVDLLEALENDGWWPNDNQDLDSLGEFDYYQGSGWMYSKNGNFPGYGFADSILKDGDVVKIRFTLAYGKDIGGYKSTGGDDTGNYGKIW